MTNQRVAVIDDEQQLADIMMDIVATAGFLPYRVEGKYHAVGDLVNLVKAEAHAAICDHRLSYRGLATFSGATLAAALIQAEIPALLVSQYIQQDFDIGIRGLRHILPVVFARTELDPESIVHGLAFCRDEMSGVRAPERTPVRAILEYRGVSNERGEKVVDVVVPQWNPTEAVSFPAKLVKRAVLARAKDTGFMIAEVNIGAERATDLFFINFETAPKVDANDGLS